MGIEADGFIEIQECLLAFPLAAPGNAAVAEYRRAFRVLQVAQDAAEKHTQ